MSETSYRPTTIVLARRNAPTEDTEHDAHEVFNESRQYDAPSVPPADRGKDAWLFLTGCFAVEGLLWSFPFAYGTYDISLYTLLRPQWLTEMWLGIFQDYYLSHNTFPGSGSSLAIVGTVSSVSEAPELYFSTMLTLLSGLHIFGLTFHLHRSEAFSQHLTVVQHCRSCHFAAGTRGSFFR